MAFLLSFYVIFKLCKLIILASQEIKNPRPLLINNDWNFNEIPKERLHKFII